MRGGFTDRAHCSPGAPTDVRDAPRRSPSELAAHVFRPTAGTPRLRRSASLRFRPSMHNGNSHPPLQRGPPRYSKRRAHARRSRAGALAIDVPNGHTSEDRSGVQDRIPTPIQVAVYPGELLVAVARQSGQPESTPVNGEDLRPVLHGLVRGEDHAAALVAKGDQPDETPASKRESGWKATSSITDSATFVSARWRRRAAFVSTRDAPARQSAWRIDPVRRKACTR